jgi:uncharacterized protein YbjT (DUF2867 family)
VPGARIEAFSVGGRFGRDVGAVRAAAAAGARVVAAGRRPPAEREPVPPGVEHAIVDVADEASVDALLAGVGRRDARERARRGRVSRAGRR